jgi:hypothetical protein
MPSDGASVQAVVGRGLLVSTSHLTQCLCRKYSVLVREYDYSWDFRCSPWLVCTGAKSIHHRVGT